MTDIYNTALSGAQECGAQLLEDPSQPGKHTNLFIAAHSAGSIPAFFGNYALDSAGGIVLLGSFFGPGASGYNRPLQLANRVPILNVQPELDGLITYPKQMHIE